MLSKLLLFLIASCLTGCVTQLTAPVVVQPQKLTVPTNLREQCKRPQEVSGNLANLGSSAVNDSRDLADCAIKHSGLLQIIDQFNEGLK